jgi:acetyl-CoA acetyltransferase
MQQYGVTREQLAMCASLMTLQASRHPHALARRPVPVQARPRLGGWQSGQLVWACTGSMLAGGGIHSTDAAGSGALQ